MKVVRGRTPPGISTVEHQAGIGGCYVPSPSTNTQGTPSQIEAASDVLIEAYRRGMMRMITDDDRQGTTCRIAATETSITRGK